MPNAADITIIGAGVNGLSIASQVAKPGRKVFVLERHKTFGHDQSSRNSEVIHAGLYYDKGSLKQTLCMEGNTLMYELCEKNGVAVKKCGKIIAAVTDAEVAAIGPFYKKAEANGVEMKMLSSKELKQLEPNMNAKAGFLCPTSGIVDSHGLLRLFHAQATRKGAQMAFKTEVTGIEKKSDGYTVHVKDPSGDSSITTTVLINASGLNSDKVSKMAGIDIDKFKYHIRYCRGEFWNVGGGKGKLVNRLIYPVPLGISVGAHVCFDTNWRFRFGPLWYYTPEVSYKVDESRKQEIVDSSIMKSLPFIKPDDLTPESAGVMAMLQGPGESFRDFIIREEKDKGLPGFVNLVGIESPGLTSSPAIGKYVSGIVDGLL